MSLVLSIEMTSFFVFHHWLMVFIVAEILCWTSKPKAAPELPVGASLTRQDVFTSVHKIDLKRAEVQLAVTQNHGTS